jgi:ADP-heptose:LPS heptosyltransferase
MGDLLMTSPAIAALKNSFGCKITLLTGSIAAAMSEHIPVIDDVIVLDVPWVKTDMTPGRDEFLKMVEVIRGRNFDGAVIFTVFSQSPFGAMLLTWLAGIPKRAAYSRENPYHLLTDWIPDPEPYTIVRHQVTRDLELVKTIGVSNGEGTFPLRIQRDRWSQLQQKLNGFGLDPQQPWIVIHPGVSESKRSFPESTWIDVGKKITSELNLQVVVTGSIDQKQMAYRLARAIGHNVISVAGEFSLAEFILLIERSALVITVNTVTAHIAAATNTKIIVLYAMTNPQHTPWRANGKIFPYSVSDNERSRNEVLQFVNKTYFDGWVPLPSTTEIIKAVRELLNTDVSFMPELVGIKANNALARESMEI